MSRRPTFVSTFRQNVLLVLLLCLPVNALYVFTHPYPYNEGSENRSDDPIYHIGSTLDIKWKQSQSNDISIALWQAVPNAVGESVCRHSTGPPSCNWIVETSRNLTLSDKFFFLMYVKGSQTYVARSRQFILRKNSTDATATADNSLPSVSDVTLSSSTADAGSNSNSSSSSSSSSPDAASNSSASSSGLSSGAKAGVGVGVAVGVAVIAGVAFIFIRRRRRQTRGSGETSHTAYGPVESGGAGIYEAPGTTPETTAELDHGAGAQFAGYNPNVARDKNEGGPQELYAPVEREVHGELPADEERRT